MKILVTGANKGIGEAICYGLAQMGSIHVLLAARQENLGLATMNAINSKYPNSTTFYQLDVTSDASVQQFTSKLKQDGHDKIDVLINNAGWASKGSNLDKQIAETTLGVNYFGLVRVTEALLPFLGPNSRIVNVASRAGQLSGRSNLNTQELTLWNKTQQQQLVSKSELDALAQSFVSAVEKDQVEQAGWPKNSYRVSKILVNQYTRWLAKQLEAQNILVNSCCPGWVKTDMGGLNAMRTPEQGAQVEIFLATAPNVGTGQFFADNAVITF